MSHRVTRSSNLFSRLVCMTTSPPPNGEFKFCSPEGRTLVLNILSSKFTYRLHDYVLDGLVKSLDGVHLLAISGTGSGKTGYYSMYMLMLQELDRQRKSYPIASAMVPQNPVMVMVLPTIGLEDEMGRTFNNLGLNTIFINHTALQTAVKRGLNLWRESRACYTIILLSPEQLVSDRFETLIHDPIFKSRSTKSFGCPDLYWVLASGRKTIMFADSIAQGWRVMEDLLAQLKKMSTATTEQQRFCVRLYCSLSERDNAATLQAFRDTNLTQIIIATDALMVGVDLPNVQDVILLSAPPSVDNMLQKIRRAGRDHNLVKDARGIVYVTKAQIVLADKAVKAISITKGHHAKMNVDIARMLLARCYPAFQNILYANPSHNPNPCSCTTCTKIFAAVQPNCNCSMCMPESKVAPDTSGIKVKSRKRGPLTRRMRNVGVKALEAFCDDLYEDGGTSIAQIPPYLFLPDAV
ncbi:P-loop containing nucleoside triphosphate hydrolase protein [Cytidiella melzeri]|nr:P-loop containing nucleoside triphosphate hydrolase protein [Cytidiella melzeri]